ncbi:copper chaperone PCu(A)C [Marinobacter sp. F4206]|uniref:copper chaperone PCu(A)C n=1 Tax=Marinobacter sp. F4206 TaxID=2861777 RepID=UPI001C5E8AC4|nr:copper chaperone PCu(A)C [Marinobacter sp. F4206]MBW4935852.1 copper chaperone PCu(A)C [Marinobacter sp. F4206]
MKVKALFVALLLALMPVLASAHDYTKGNLNIDHPWSRPTPPGTPMGVGYLAITNTSDVDLTLTDAKTPRAGHVSIHESSMRDGVMSMKPMKQGLTIPAGETVELKPHGYHLMLEKLPEPLVEGERIPLTLKFDSGETVQVELSVEPLDGGGMKQTMDHSGHRME